MFCYGTMFNVEGIDVLIEQTRCLRDLYESYKKDVLRDNDDSVPHFSLTLGAQMQKTPEGPKIHIVMEHRAYVEATLKAQKEKIEQLLEGIKTLESSAAKFEAEMNGDETPAALEQEFMQTHSGHKSTAYYGPDNEPDALFRVESRDRIQEAIDGMTEEERNAVYSQVGKSLQDLATMTTDLLCGALTSAEKKKSEQDTDSVKPVISGSEYFDETKQEFIYGNQGW